MTAYNPPPSQLTINELNARGFLSDTRDGRVQKFFAWYDANKDREDFDGHEAQEREAEAGVTAADWTAYRDSFDIEF